VQVHDDEEHRCPGRVHVADQPAPLDLAHDVFDRVEGSELARLEMHGEEYAREDLHHEHEQRERTEEIPDVEVLRRVVADELALHELVDGHSFVVPDADPAFAGGSCGDVRHHATPSCGSTPITSVSPRNAWGGTTRLAEAGDPDITQTAR